MFAKDRDLLVHEPDVFSDIAWAGQRLLTLPSAQVSAGSTLYVEFFSFDAWGVGVGSVLLLDGRAVEVVSLPSQDTVLFSALRGDVSDSPRPVFGLGSSVAVEAHTFVPQLREVHGRVLRSLGLADQTTDDMLGADRVTNGAAVVEVEALGALSLIFAAAGRVGNGSSPMSMRAAQYASRFEEALRRLRVEVDLDGDGAPDATRRVGVVRMHRGRA
ncbi:MAG: hypothetical protein AAFX05_10485 [Planctomycetota bacterium]